MGRVVVGRVVHEKTDSIVVIDGQQRLTTVSILLSAVRDFAENFFETVYNKSSRSTSDKDQALNTMQKIVHLCDSTTLQDDGSNCTVVMQPSYFDREDYQRCFVKAGNSSKSCNTTIDLRDGTIASARKFFDTSLADGSLFSMIASTGRQDDEAVEPVDQDQIIDLCLVVVVIVLHKLQLLYFEVSEQDIQTVYERLAMREAMLSTQANNSRPGIKMAEIDLVRNYITSYFSPDVNSESCRKYVIDGSDVVEKQVFIYLNYWAPIENLATKYGMVLHQDDDSEDDCLVSSVDDNPVVESDLQQDLGTHFQKVGNRGKSSNTVTNSSFIIARKDDDDNLVSGLTHFIQCFILILPRISVDTDKTIADTEETEGSEYRQLGDPGAVNFPLYESVKRCFSRELSKHKLANLLSPTAESENVVETLLQKMLAFSKVYWSQTK